MRTFDPVTTDKVTGSHTGSAGALGPTSGPGSLVVLALQTDNPVHKLKQNTERGCHRRDPPHTLVPGWLDF